MASGNTVPFNHGSLSLKTAWVGSKTWDDYIIDLVNVNVTFTTNPDATFLGDIITTTTKYLGLGSGKGRFVFTDDTTDTIGVLNANFGVGVSAPAHLLTINATGAAGTPEFAMYTDNSQANARNWAFATEQSVNGDFVLYQSNAKGGNPLTAGTPAIYIKNDRSIHLGGNSPSYFLDVNGTFGAAGTVNFATVVNAGVDTDKFLVLDGSDNVDFRTGAEVLSDIGAAPLAAQGADTEVTIWNATGVTDVNTETSANSAFGFDAAYKDLDFQTTSASSHIFSMIQGGTGNCVVNVTGNSSSDDVYYAIRRNGTSEDWSIGIDVTDTSAFKISNYTSPGLNDYLEIAHTTGLVTIPNNLLAGGSIYHDDAALEIQQDGLQNVNFFSSATTGNDPVINISKYVTGESLFTVSLGLEDDNGRLRLTGEPFEIYLANPRLFLSDSDTGNSVILGGNNDDFTVNSDNFLLTQSNLRLIGDDGGIFADDYLFELNDAQLTHKWTNQVDDSTYGAFKQADECDTGGLQIDAYSSSSSPCLDFMAFGGASGAYNTPIIKFTAVKSTGATPAVAQDMGADDEVFEILNNATSLMLMLGDGDVTFAGTGSFSGALTATNLNLTHTAPYIVCTNSTTEDIESGRESQIRFKGRQSGGELSTLALIQASHNGTGDDQAGDLIFYTNDGLDGDSPTEALRIDSVQLATFAGNVDLQSGTVHGNIAMDTGSQIQVNAGTPGYIEFLDSGVDEINFRTCKVEMGDTSNHTEFSTTGDQVFVGTAGLPYAEIYAHDANDTLTISGSGVANKVQITTFDTNGCSNNMTPDHTNDHITVDKAGCYLCTVSISAESAAGAGYEAGFSVWKNNGDTEFDNCHAHRNLTGGGGDVGSITMSGIIDLAASDTIEVWTWNETNTVDIIIDDITLSLVQVGGT